jgi:hypothetical protein
MALWTCSCSLTVPAAFQHHLQLTVPAASINSVNQHLSYAVLYGWSPPALQDVSLVVVAAVDGVWSSRHPPTGKLSSARPFCPPSARSLPCCPAAMYRLPVMPAANSMVEQQTASQPSSRPAASKRAVASLPTLRLDSAEALESVGGPTTKCPVCTEELVVGDEVQQLPCKHCYHVDCLKPWLKQVKGQGMHPRAQALMVCGSVRVCDALRACVWGGGGGGGVTDE